MTTIYEKTSGALIKTGERSITSFPSGLIRVDQLYVGTTTEESNHRSQLAYAAQMPDQDDTPAIDGLFIFPEVQESRDGLGFTKYQCSGYGRTTDVYRELTRGQDVLAVGSGQYDLKVNVFNMTGVITKRRGEVFSNDDIEFTDDFLKPVSVQYTNYPFIQFLAVTEINVSASTPINRQYTAQFQATTLLQAAIFTISDPVIEIIAQRNFGEFVEYEFLARRIPITELEEPA